MNYDNEMSITIPSLSQNEMLARLCVSGFISGLDPKISDINDIKLAVSEAVTNSIIHGYENEKGNIYINLKLKDRTLYIEIIDNGKGIKDIKKAMEPLYTSKPELERSGMGFTVMEAFMDEISVISKEFEGTKVIMKKSI